MQVVNRSAMLIRPKQPYLDWANNVAQSMEMLGELRMQSAVILIPESAYQDGAQSYLGLNYATIFESELDRWSSNRDHWPPARHYEMFIAWFDVEVYALVLDASNHDRIRKEPYI